MRKINLVACGLSPATLTHQAEEALREARLCLGAPRLLADFAPPGASQVAAYLPADVTMVLTERTENNVAILLSGDSGFFSACRLLIPVLNDVEVNVLPGISSLNYFFAKLKRPWQDVKLMSCHGREANLVDAVRRNATTFALTSGNLSPYLEALQQVGFGDLRIQVGENLALPEEKIYEGAVSDFIGRSFPSLTVMVIDNPGPDRSCRIGISDDEFIRGESPMTKAGVRSVVLSKLALSPEDVVLDLGCGTGSVTVEIGLQTYEGKVIAVDKNPAAVALTKANAARFRLGNVECRQADLAVALEQIDHFDKVFIGGGGPRLIAQLIRCIARKNPRTKVVGTALLIESLQAFTQAFEEVGWDYDWLQVQVSRGRKFASYHGFQSENPITVISGGGRYAG